MEEQTSSGTTVKIAVECKAYSRPVGIDVVNRFATLAHLLRQRNLIDKGMIVSAAGFTPNAREAAREHQIDLLEISDLKRRVQGREQEVLRAKRDVELAHDETARSPDRVKRAFVLMPFASSFEDVYSLGVREVAEKLGMSAERTDDIEHNQGILDVIYERIRSSDVIVADTTNQNPNVFYEIGFAHALGKPTILIARTGEKIPFDLRNMNHIFYETILDLRDKLQSRLRATLKLESPE